jgi:hypothetical protein
VRATRSLAGDALVAAADSISMVVSLRSRSIASIDAASSFEESTSSAFSRRRVETSSRAAREVWRA